MLPIQPMVRQPTDPFTKVLLNLEKNNQMKANEPMFKVVAVFVFVIPPNRATAIRDTDSTSVFCHVQKTGDAWDQLLDERMD